jgi:hypothetical protein
MGGRIRGRWGWCALCLSLALAGCSDGGSADPTDGWMPGATGGESGSEGEPPVGEDDDDGDDAPDPDDGPVPGTTGGEGDESGSDGSDGGPVDTSEWCVYTVVPSGEIDHLNVHAEPDQTSSIQFTLKAGETVWGGSTVIDGFRDLDRALDLPQWADATRLENTGECESDDDPPPAEVPLPQGFQLPFDCGQVWRLDSWGHAPALDMVREPDQVGTNGATLRAPAAGVVNQSYYHDNAGNLVQIDHGDGWYTTFIHMDSRSVDVGDVLAQGDMIGAVGATGPTSNGHPHLHFELGVDADGDGEASWGFEGAERVKPWFDGIEYGQSDGLTWRDVVSNNCP